MLFVMLWLRDVRKELEIYNLVTIRPRQVVEMEALSCIDKELNKKVRQKLLKASVSFKLKCNFLSKSDQLPYNKPISNTPFPRFRVFSTSLDISCIQIPKRMSLLGQKLGRFP